MAAILLTGFKIRSYTMRVVDFGSTLTPPLGGQVQRVNRLGNRYAMDVTIPPLPEEPDGRLLTALLDQALTQGAMIAVPQMRLTIPNPGTPVVDTSTSSGNNLYLRGLPASYSLKAGQFVSVIHSGQRYLYRLQADRVADGTGRTSLLVMPLLRTLLSDGDVVEITTPILQGLIDLPSWDVQVEPFISTSFRITEAA